jgi:peptidoglycan/xylan/chitin deacetylase (PgdA/CDA1 family)
MDRRTFLAAAATSVLAIACSGGDETSSDARTGTTTTTDRIASGDFPSTSAPPPSTKAPGPARFVSTGPHDAPRVALTFHTNGAVGLVQQLLDTLSARHVVVTTFIVGDWLDANPTFAKKIVDGGHELANHTYTHPSFLSLSQDAMRDEIVRCRDVITRLTGEPPTFFRPSGTDDGTAAPPQAVLDVAGAAGYPTVLGFDVDPFDYQDPGAAAITQRTLAAVGRGSVVSLHFGHAGTVAALPGILDGLDAKGLTPVTASKLLGS